MQAAAGELTGFTGVLVRRQYKPGQKYVQLVFKTADGIQLSLSRNVSTIKNLHIGRTYQVKGRELIAGSKRFIHEPEAILVKSQPKFNKKSKIAALVMAMFIVPAAAMAFVPDKQTPTTTKPSTSTSKTQQVTNAAEPVTSQPATPPTPTPPATTSAKKAVPISKAAAVPATPQASNPASQSPAAVNEIPQSETLPSSGATNETIPAVTDGESTNTPPEDETTSPEL